MQPRTVFLAFFILCSYFCAGQSNNKKISKGGIGFSVIPFGRNTVYAGLENEVEGRGMYIYSNKPIYSGHLYGFFNIKKNTRMVVGFGCSRIEIFATEKYTGQNYYYTDNIRIYSLPIYIRKTIFNYIFLTYGGIVSIAGNFLEDTNPTRLDGQNGFGFTTGLGGTYHFKSGITVYAGPSAFIYSIISPQNFVFGDKVAGLGAEFGMSVDL